MAAETGFDIDGTVYPVPELDSFDMDEAQVLYDYSGLIIEDFVQLPPDASDEEREQREQKLKNPGLIRSLMHVAYQRGNPKAKPAKVRELVGKANIIASYNGLLGEEGEEELPPASTTEPVPQSQNEPVISNESSGDASTNASAQQDDTLVITGTGRSDTSSPLSALTT